MLNQIKKNFIERYFDHRVEIGEKKGMTWIKLSTCVFLYTITIFIQGYTNPDEIIKGIVAQVQLMISVYMVVGVIKKGYISAMIINILQCILVARTVIQNNNINALTGVIVSICTIIIISVISFFGRRLNKKMIEVVQQREEIVILYEELSATEQELLGQNQQLLEYNRLLEEKEEKLNYLAYFDSLTELPNRKMVIDRLEMLINFSSQNYLKFFVVFIDLDNFKRINDSMGHYIGDLLLQSVVSRFKTVISNGDMLGRLGGDEFALITQRYIKEEEVFEYVESLRKVLLGPFTIEKTELSITASLGISIYPQDGIDSAELLKCADTAMYKAKENGKNAIQFFRKEMKEEILKKIEFESRLMVAIQNQEISLVFQPQYHSGTKRLRGFEALVRWQSRELGRVNPAKFIQLAEENGFIIPLGEWILKTVCHKIKHIQEKYSGNFLIGMNISAVQIMDPHFVQRVKQTVGEAGVDAKFLEFEITESIFISSMEKAVRVLNELKELGIHIALDDFGTGYSSLIYIQQLPIDTLKIDQSFVANIDNHNSKNQIIGAIISLVHQMDISVIAEGVETDTQLAYLKAHQCDFIQGYLWGQPLDERDLDLLLQKLSTENSRD